MMKRFIPQLFIYILVFFLLREWLIPVVELTNTGYTEYILGFVGMALLLRLVKMPWFISAILQISYIIVFIFYVYTENLSLLSIWMLCNFLRQSGALM